MGLQPGQIIEQYWKHVSLQCIECVLLTCITELLSQSTRYFKFKWLQQEPNQQPLGSYTHSQHTNQIRTHNIAQSSSQFGQKSECSFTKYKYVNSTLVTVTKISSVTPFWLRIPLKFKELQSILHFVVGKPLNKCLCRLCLCYPVTSLTKALLQLILLSLS